MIIDENFVSGFSNTIRLLHLVVFIKNIYLRIVAFPNHDQAKALSLDAILK